MQRKEELDNFYSNEDPWGYITNPDDSKRKEIILSLLDKYDRALDIGCGEGFITKDLPAKEIYGYDVSDVAMKRLPSNVKPLKVIEGKFDLIIATGVLYKQYDYKWILNKIKECACGTVITCNIKDWEINDLENQVSEMEFPYREFTQKLRIYDFTSLNRRGTPKSKHKKTDTRK
jgi:hypothetical protein